MADRHATGGFAWSRIMGSPGRLPRGRIARGLFCVEQRRMVLLHGFIKKTQKTPHHDIDVALNRKKGAST
jgi:Phage derived protein Gp49-like (DUF891)